MKLCCCCCLKILKVLLLLLLLQADLLVIKMPSQALQTAQKLPPGCRGEVVALILRISSSSQTPVSQLCIVTHQKQKWTTALLRSTKQRSAPSEFHAWCWFNLDWLRYNNFSIRKTEGRKTNPSLVPQLQRFRFREAWICSILLSFPSKFCLRTLKSFLIWFHIYRFFFFFSKVNCQLSSNNSVGWCTADFWGTLN